MGPWDVKLGQRYPSTRSHRHRELTPSAATAQPALHPTRYEKMVLAVDVEVELLKAEEEDTDFAIAVYY
jgi:hypothetical protein